MKRTPLVAALALLFCPAAPGSQTAVTLPEASPAASVSQTVGISSVTVTYHRPSVLGREVWGRLVPYGFNDLGFGTSKAAPWRAGANENTLVTFQHDVSVAGAPLKAGTYGLFMALSPEGAVTVIFSRDTGAWGSFFYDAAHDVLRVPVRWEDAPFREQLTYDFSDVTGDSAVLALSWEKKRIPIPLKFDTVAIVEAGLKEELTGSRQFRYYAWLEASGYLLENNVDLPLALTWADFAVNDGFAGDRNFKTLSNKADILEKLGRTAEANAVMDEALKLRGHPRHPPVRQAPALDAQHRARPGGVQAQRPAPSRCVARELRAGPRVFRGGGLQGRARGAPEGAGPGPEGRQRQRRGRQAEH